MYIRIFKDNKRTDGQTFKKRVKNGKGKVKSKAQGSAFNHYESTVKSVPLEIGTDAERQEAKLYQRKNEFVSYVAISEPKTDISYLTNNSTNRSYLKNKGIKYQTSKDNRSLIVINHTPVINKLEKGRLVSAKSDYRGYIDLPITASLNDVLTAAFRLCVKTPENLEKRDKVYKRNELGHMVYHEGDYVLNAKMLILNEGGQPLKSILGSSTKSCVNIHEVRVDKVICDAATGKHICLFNKSTIKHYSKGGKYAKGLVEQAKYLVDFEAFSTEFGN